MPGSRSRQFPERSSAALWIGMLLPVAPLLFVFWLWQQLGLLPGKEVAGTMAKLGLSGIIVGPWAWYGFRCAKELYCRGKRRSLRVTDLER